MTVVEDGPDWLVLWLAPGTRVVASPLADGRDMREAPLHERFTLPRVAVPRRWHGSGILKLVPPAAPYSVWLFWDEDGTFLGWYGNLEDAHVRWSRDGWRVIDTVDHVLDIWVPAHEPPRWKDEDEFAVTTGMPGFWDAVQAKRIRAQAAALIDLAARGKPPFDHTWTGFRPDPAWPIPDLPDSWDASRAAGPAAKDIGEAAFLR